MDLGQHENSLQTGIGRKPLDYLIIDVYKCSETNDSANTKAIPKETLEGEYEWLYSTGWSSYRYVNQVIEKMPAGKYIVQCTNDTSQTNNHLVKSSKQEPFALRVFVDGTSCTLEQLH